MILMLAAWKVGKKGEAPRNDLDFERARDGPIGSFSPLNPAVPETLALPLCPVRSR